MNRRSEDYAGLDLNRFERTYMEAIERRIGWLERRIADYRNDGNPSRDMTELAALQWALAVIKTARAIGDDHA